jgi:hypothetical protein
MPAVKTLTRKPAVLSLKTEKWIFTYAAAAGAAGVSILALAQPSEAKVVYTPTHQIVPFSLSLDLNHDGIVDFTLLNSAADAGAIRNTGSGVSEGQLLVSPAQPGNGVVGFSNPILYASAIASKFRVAASDHFLSKSFLDMEVCLRTSFSTVVNNGKWINAKNKYLGLKFVINGQTHFGWARLSVKRSACHISAVLTGYAYETVANRPIHTGQTAGSVEVADLIDPAPASLGLLSRGAEALDLWRREDDSLVQGN